MTCASILPAALVLVVGLAVTPKVQAQTTFSNAAPITINDNSIASPYPSTISVTGLTGNVTKVTVTLGNINHVFPDDVGVLLVGPTGVKVRLMTDAGGGVPLTDVTITFDDAAPATVPDDGPIVSGTSYKPTQGIISLLSGEHDPNFFPPAPASPYAITLASFNGTNGNGTWSLYVDDDTDPDGGSISLGWSITITAGGAGTATSFSNTAPIASGDASAGTPYPSDIAVSGVTGTVTKVTVTLNGLTHTFPDDVGVLVVSPTGAKVRLMTDVGRGTDVPNITLTFDDAAPTSLPDEAAITPGTYKPTQGTAPDAGAGDLHPPNFPAPAPVSPYSLLMSSLNSGSPNGTWSLYLDDDTAADAGAISQGWSLTITTSVVTAANVSLSGRVFSGKATPVSKARVSLTDAGGGVRHVLTNSFGYYRFDAIAAGQTYVIVVSSKQDRFSPRVLTVNEDLTDVDFIADP